MIIIWIWEAKYAIQINLNCNFRFLSLQLRLEDRWKKMNCATFWRDEEQDCGREEAREKHVAVWPSHAWSLPETTGLSTVLWQPWHAWLPRDGSWTSTPLKPPKWSSFYHFHHRSLLSCRGAEQGCYPQSSSAAGLDRTLQGDAEDLDLSSAGPAIFLLFPLLFSPYPWHHSLAPSEIPN